MYLYFRVLMYSGLSSIALKIQITGLHNTLSFICFHTNHTTHAKWLLKDPIRSNCNNVQLIVTDWRHMASQTLVTTWSENGMWPEMLVLVPMPEFPHVAIAVSPQLEVESNGHAWLDVCNCQRKRLLAPRSTDSTTLWVQRIPKRPMRTYMIRRIYMNSGTVTTLYFYVWNEFFNPNRVLIIRSYFFLKKFHSLVSKTSP